MIEDKEVIYTLLVIYELQESGVFDETECVNTLWETFDVSEIDAAIDFYKHHAPPNYKRLAKIFHKILGPGQYMAIDDWEVFFEYMQVNSNFVELN